MPAWNSLRAREATADSAPTLPGTQGALRVRQRLEARPDARAVGVALDARAQLVALLGGGERRLGDRPPTDDAAPQPVDHLRSGEPAAVAGAEGRAAQLAQVEPQRRHVDRLVGADAADHLGG